MVAATSSTVMNCFFGIGSSMMRWITSCSLMPCVRVWGRFRAKGRGAGETALARE
jgi:hypothetical protein